MRHELAGSLAIALLSLSLPFAISCGGGSDGPPLEGSAEAALSSEGGGATGVGGAESAGTLTPEGQRSDAPAVHEPAAGEPAGELGSEGQAEALSPSVVDDMSREEAAARAGALRRARDVLEVFLTTRHPRLRYALLSERARGAVTAAGVETFYASAPGLFDVPLPLAPGSYNVRRVSAEQGGLTRFVVRWRGASDTGARRVSYVTIREERDGARVVWDRLPLAEAQLALTRGEYREAERIASAILDWSPLCGDCHETIFWAQSRRMGGHEAWRRAGEHARRAVELEPDVAAHHNALGVYHRNMRNYGSAERELMRAVELDPDSPAAGNIALLLEFQSRNKEALAIVDDFIERQPNELWGHMTRCRLLKRLDHYEEAISSCRAAVERARSTDERAHVSTAYYLLAYCLLRAGHADEARQPIERAIELRPNYWLFVQLREEIVGES